MLTLTRGEPGPVHVAAYLDELVRVDARVLGVQPLLALERLVLGHLLHHTLALGARKTDGIG